MNNHSLEQEILSSVQNLDGNQKTDLLDYIKNIKPEEVRSKKSYRRAAMKQIREALQNT